MIRVRKWSGAVWGGGLGAHSSQFSSVVAGSVGLLLLIADMERDYEKKKTSLLLVDKMKKNHTGRGGCPLPPLSQLCSHPEGSLLSVESRWSMQTLIWGLSEGITVHTLPQCEWLVTYHKQEGGAVKHDRQASSTDSPCAPVLLRQTHIWFFYISVHHLQSSTSTTYWSARTDAPWHMTNLICCL